MNFSMLEKDLMNAIAADEKYKRENDAKFRAVEQKVATYDEFRDIVAASHLRPLDKKEKIVDPEGPKKVIWNVSASNRDNDSFNYTISTNKKHFTEQ